MHACRVAFEANGARAYSFNRNVGKCSSIHRSARVFQSQLKHNSFRSVFGACDTKFFRSNRLDVFLTYTPARLRSFSTMSANIKIGTHDGCFHCDEALACFLLKTLPRYKDAEIVRSRDLSILSTCDIVVDVGQKYDPSTHRYDHHMRDFKESVSTVIKKPGYNWKMKLSSAGLIYCHFGMEILKLLLPNMSDSDIEQIFKRVYGTFIYEIDGIDNGVPMFDGEPEYRIVTDISSRVDFLNAPWNSEGIDVDRQFLKAVELTGQDFMQHVNRAAYVWLPARSIVEEAIQNRFEVDPSGEIIVLSRGTTWQEHLFRIEEELKLEPTLKYVIFKDKEYRVRAVPVKSSSFVCRIFLPEAWAGLRDKDLEVASGIEGTMFVHTVRFIGGHKTKDGAIMMARKSLEIAKAGSS
ncbi:MYG1 protein C27H6.8 [Halictus rubicundus]|uniref:MYG1 protein C27H6.8 n=1 Tax=Halictus rubicundus TaxID=77578 RepID=UPI00403688D4